MKSENVNPQKSIGVGITVTVYGTGPRHFLRPLVFDPLTFTISNSVLKLFTYQSDVSQIHFT